MNIVISQPMFLPWIGLFEQIRLSDIYIHYDDVHIPMGRSLISRVQVKTASGVSWLTAPVDRVKSSPLIRDTLLVSDRGWRKKHLETLRHCYAKTPFFTTMFELAREIYSYPGDNLSDFNQYGIERISAWLGLTTRFLRSSELNTSGSSTQRLVELCRKFSAKTYITGLGALNYLDYSKFEVHGIDVNYMVYKKHPYPQMYGEFTPYVTILDAISCCGSDTIDLLSSNAIYWKDYVNEPR